MSSPADQLAEILTQALNKWVKDNPGLFTVNVTEPGDSSGGGGGGSAPDLLGIILGLAALGVSLNPEMLGATAAIKGVQDAGGAQGAWFGSGWFLGETLLKFADPYSRMLTHAVEASVTSQIFDPATAAQLQAKRILTHEQAVSEAAGNGLDGQHVSWLVEHASAYPGLAEALRLWNLGHLDEAGVDLILDRQGVPESMRAPLKHLRRQYLSIADLALGTLRGDIKPEDARAYANELGMTDEDFARFVYNTGEPPGIMQMLELFRRDKVDEQTLTRAILQSRVRDEWVQAIIDLRYQPMSAADAITATVQNHLTYPDGLAKATVAGLEPGDFDTLYQTAGEPLSRTEMQELYNRGEATEEQVKQAARESRLKDKYIDLSFSLHRRLIPYRTINTIIGHGVRDQKWGINYLMDLGYTHDDATALVSTSASAKTAHIKALTESQILTLWESQALSEKEAVDQLGTIGYAPDEAKFLLEYTAAKRAVSEQNKAVTSLRAGYLNHRVTIEEASAAMDKIGVPPGQRDQLKTDWQIERDSQVKVLTVPEITAAVKHGVVAFADAQAKLVEMGYSNNDAKVVIAGAVGGVPKDVTIDPIS